MRGHASRGGRDGVPRAARARGSGRHEVLHVLRGANRRRAPAAGGRGDARDGRHRDVARRHGRPLRCDDCDSHRGDDSGIDRGPTAAESPATAAPSTSDAEETPATTEAVRRRLPSQPTPLHLRNPLGGLAVAPRIVQAAGRAGSCQSAQDRPASLIAKHPVDDVFLTDAVAISHTDAIKRKQSLRIVVIDRPERCQLPFERCGI